MNTKNLSWLEFIELTFTIPGSGVYTLHTANDKKLAVTQALYGSGIQNAEFKWKDSLKSYKNEPSIALYGIPCDTGGGIQRGANWGPLAIRAAILKNPKDERAWIKPVFDLGDVKVNPHLLQDDLLNDKTIKKIQQSMYGSIPTAKNFLSDLPVSALDITQKMLELHHAEFPKVNLLMLGGDHSVSYPAISEYIKSRRKLGHNPAIIHFDAHTDLLHERLGIPICFGSWTSHIIPLLANPSQLIQIGIRSSGKTKEHWESTFGIKQYWSNEIQKMGTQAVCDEIKEWLKQSKTDEIYITFDIDALDGSEASATGTPERNGLHTNDCIEMIDLLTDAFNLTGADLVEVAPFVHHPEFIQNEPETTLKNAVKLTRCLIRGLQKNLS